MRLPLLLLVLAPLATAQDVGLDAFEERFGDRAVLDRPGEAVVPGRFARFLEGVDVRLEIVDETPRGGVGLGFEYGVAKQLVDTSDTVDSSIDFVARGNVAFEPEANPDDYQWFAFRSRWFGSRTLQGAEDATRARRLAELSSEPDLPTFDEFARALPDELAWDFDIHAGLETTQDFSQQQIVLGAAVSGRYITWREAPGIARFNVFDYPAAAVRWLSGRDERFTPTSRALPAATLGLDVVDGSQVDGRDLADQDTYLRWKLALTWRSPIWGEGPDALDLVANWRLFEEFDAPGEVDLAGLDRSNHLALTLELPRDWSLTYTTGRLPLDGQDDSTFALGYSLRL